MPLDDYRAKRDPARTPEPFGAARTGGGQRFVVQKHAARRLHYDLRLEIDGTLKSWAVPRGPSVRPEEKRLAVHVEDHPIEYADFEGRIPEGNYGAGAVIVWDRGWYRLAKDRPAAEQLTAGKIEVDFFGVKMRGRWTLARMGGKDKEWLLLKKADGFTADEELTDRFPESVLSGLTVEEVRDGAAAVGRLRERLAALEPPAREVTAGAGLMLASSAERAFSGPEWLFEIKYDGVRVLAEREAEHVSLRGRSGQDVTARYPEIVRALRALPVDRFVLDGEVVAFDERGRPSFQRLQARMHLARPAEVERASAQVPVTAVFFDCLGVAGRDLRDLPLSERKGCLSLFVPARGVIRYGDHVAGQGEAFFEAADEQRLEGIVAKKVASRYVAGRTRDWLKIKCHRREDFVIGGFTAPQGSRGFFGALHVGLYEGDRLIYVSKVGTGFDDRTLALVAARLEPVQRGTSPFAAGTPAGRGHTWVEPRLVCEVRFTDWTEEGGLRHPTFLGLRDDKRPQECRRESATPDALPPPPASREPAPKAVVVTNPGKVFWPAEGYTKADLVAYYEAAAPLMLPYLRDRPLVLTRFPDGITGKSFYQKDAPEWTPEWVRRVRVDHSDKAVDYFVVDDVETLRYVANTASIPLHVWSSRVGALEHPDWLILDLDPKGAPFTDVVKVARALKRILDGLDLPSYVKTSGATGLHILLPLGARYTHEEARAFGKLLAMMGVEAEPEISTIARVIRTRGGKVYIDFGQNAHGQTIVAPFSVRPLPGAPVSCSLSWDEVTARLDPKAFTIKTALARFSRRPDPLTPILGDGIDMGKALARLREGEGPPPGAF